MYLNASIDLETLGTSPFSVVTSIGCTLFNFGLPITENNPTFEIHIDIEDSMERGLNSDPATLLWWEGQGPEAKAIFQAGQDKAVKLPEAIAAFDAFIIENCNTSKLRVWGNGASFDISLIECLYKIVGSRGPWSYWNIRDMRTICDYMPNARKEIPFKGVRHCAVSDSFHQAEVIQAAHNRILGKF